MNDEIEGTYYSSFIIYHLSSHGTSLLLTLLSIIKLDVAQQLITSTITENICKTIASSFLISIIALAS
jgi:hypothetical protein